ncbi:MAG: hypothetical protein ACP5I4_12040 [Oceanipulchritudo sp.]
MKSIPVMLLIALLTLAGCGGGADTETPVADLKADAGTMSVADLQAKAEEYQAAIADKMKELEPIKAKLAEIPVMEQMGEEAKALQDDIAAVTEDISALKDRLQVYMDALKEKGVDVSKYMK